MSRRANILLDLALTIGLAGLIGMCVSIFTSRLTGIGTGLIAFVVIHALCWSHE